MFHTWNIEKLKRKGKNMRDKFINHITSREFLFNLKLLLLSLSIFLYIIGNKIPNKVKRYFIKILFFLTFYVLIIPLLKR